MKRIDWMEDLKWICVGIAILFLSAGMLVHIWGTHSITPTGDVNRDGRVNAVDLTMLYRHLEGAYDLSRSQIRIGDINKNGRIDQRDIDTLVDVMLERPAEKEDTK